MEAWVTISRCTNLLGVIAATPLISGIAIVGQAGEPVAYLITLKEC